MHDKKTGIYVTKGNEMNILVLCTKFAMSESDGSLSNDLVAAFAQAGHRVTVICLEWSGTTRAEVKTLYGSATILNIPVDLQRAAAWPHAIQKAYKWFLASRNAISMVDAGLLEKHYDLFVGFSPASACFWLQKHLLKKFKIKKKYMILWDFFPRYHAELGLIPKGPVYWIAKYLESSAIRDFDTIGVMSQANISFFRKEFTSYRGNIEVLRLWGPQTVPPQGDSAIIRTQYGLAQNSLICIFGGQLIPGRGIELLLRLADAVRTKLPNVFFVVAGKGPLEHYLTENLENGKHPNVRYLGQLPREQYLQFLTICDIGLVFNSGTVTVPTFASKTIDYLRAGKPILGAVEANTDYSEILENEIKAGYSCVTTDIEQLIANLTALCENPKMRQEMGLNGRQYFNKYMTSPIISNQITNSSS